MCLPCLFESASRTSVHKPLSHAQVLRFSVYDMDLLRAERDRLLAESERLLKAFDMAARKSNDEGTSFSWLYIQWCDPNGSFLTDGSDPTS